MTSRPHSIVDASPTARISDIPPTPPTPHPHRSHTIDLIDHRIDSIKGWRRARKPTHASAQEWELPHHPYHEYVRELIAAGWTNLQDLDDYLGGQGAVSYAQQGVIISVLDISTDGALKFWPDLHNELDLKAFMLRNTRSGDRNANVRLYLAESHGSPSAALMETLGSELKLDPRFFRWSILTTRNGHVFTPSQRHRAPYLSIGFGVLDASTPQKTDAEKFKVLVYIQPDAEGNGWTGVLLFSSHTKIDISPRILIDPPPFHSPIPPRTSLGRRSFRELYIESLPLINLKDAVSSPFYALSSLFRLNCFCWNQIITAIRDEDRRINGISDTTIGHTEEIKKTLSVVERGGSLGWLGREEAATKQCRDDLKEDFTHLVEQTDFLWQTRSKMEAIRQRNSDTRWTSLTNAFTYIFAPVTIMSGIYGMNVSQISGSSSNPNIWQFFVAVAAFNITVIIALSISTWLQIQRNHGRSAGLKEILGYSVGRVSAR